MFTLAATLLTLTTLLGAGLIVLLQATKPVGLDWPLGASHGALGVIGYVTLAVAWAAVPRADPGGFGVTALIMLALAVAGGLAIFIARLHRQEPPIVVLTLHATMGAAGVVMLAAYLAA
jgi:hypothetical protein